MARSMTSFARAAGSSHENHWAVEIRSVNHRYFEFSVKLPPVLSALEGQIRDRVKEELKRGKITAQISRDGDSAKDRRLAFDEEAVAYYLKGLQKLKKKFKLAGDITANDILRFPGIFTNEEAQGDPEAHWPAVKKVLGKALAETLKARELEGGKLAQDILERLDAIDAAVKKIEKAAKSEPERIRGKLQERVEQLLADRARDADRLEREVAFLAERCDITEEVVRLKSHLALFRSRLKADGEMGRELDFLCQEINREINTMGSKSQLFEISTEVVFAKGELEKIREQIQNIE